MGYSSEEFYQVLNMFPAFEGVDDAFAEALYWDFKIAEQRHQAEPIDYLKYRFWEKTDDQRAAYITRRQYAALSAEVNDPASSEVFLDKSRFVERYRRFFRRESAVPGIDGLRTLRGLCRRHDYLVLKSAKGAYGRGISFVGTDDPEKLWQQCIDQGMYVEEPIVQHATLSAFHPNSVNSMRMLTVAPKGLKPHVLAAALRCGIGDMITDSGEGLFAAVDVNTGLICTDGVSHIGERYVTHPDTGIRFERYRVPLFDDLVQLVVGVASADAGLRLVNWDCALDTRGHWVLLEGNVNGGIGPCQEALGRGLKHEVQEALGLV